MPIDFLYLIQHDRQPYYYVTVQDSTGGAIDITGATIRCTMRQENSTVIAINRVSTNIAITAATAGQFEYRWGAGETNSTGIFDIEFEVTPASGGKFTLPNPAYGVAHIHILPDLDAT